MSNGLFLKPMVVVDVKQEIKIVTEETFGPVLPVIPFDTEYLKAIRLANDFTY